jgi:hypothetical protein
LDSGVQVYVHAYSFEGKFTSAASGRLSLHILPLARSENLIHNSILTFDHLARPAPVPLRRGDGPEQTEEIDCAGKSERQNGKQRKHRDAERN